MVADLAQLHEHIHDAEEVGVVECLLGLITIDVLVVEQPLSARQIALHDVLHLLGQLLLHVLLQSAE